MASPPPLYILGFIPLKEYTLRNQIDQEQQLKYQDNYSPALHYQMRAKFHKEKSCPCLSRSLSKNAAAVYPSDIFLAKHLWYSVFVPFVCTHFASGLQCVKIWDENVSEWSNIYHWKKMASAMWQGQGEQSQKTAHWNKGGRREGPVWAEVSEAPH